MNLVKYCNKQNDAVVVHVYILISKSHLNFLATAIFGFSRNRKPLVFIRRFTSH
jgi:hypothetical protein